MPSSTHNGMSVISHNNIIAINNILSQLPQDSVLPRVECNVFMIFCKRRIGCVMALRYAVLAFLSVAYVHDLTWSRLFVSAFNLHGNIKGQPIVVDRPLKRKEIINEKRILKRLDPAFPDSTLPQVKVSFGVIQIFFLKC